jgi:hypothetical protein
MDGYHMSWIVQILPCLEQQNAYKKIDFPEACMPSESRQVRAPRAGFSVRRMEPALGTTADGDLFARILRGISGIRPIDADRHGVLSQQQRPLGRSRMEFQHDYVGETAGPAPDLIHLGGCPGREARCETSDRPVEARRTARRCTGTGTVGRRRRHRMAKSAMPQAPQFGRTEKSCRWTRRRAPVAGTWAAISHRRRLLA